MFMRSSLKKFLICFIIVVLLAAGYGGFALFRKLPMVQPVLSNPATQTTTSNLQWPNTGQSAVGVLGTSIINTHNPQTLLPTASTAKLITALVILRAKPLSLNEQGPLITITAQDMSIYSSYLAEQGSVMPVSLNEQLSEYQMLEAMLLPSANNIADALAIWAYGSLNSYSQAANSYLQQLGLSSTHVGSDASGYSPTTVSSAADLVKIGELVLENPVLASIVKESEASGLPIAGTIKNVNSLLGEDGIIGIKTGNTDQAGGVFVGAAETTVNNQSVVVVMAEMGAPTLADALKLSLPFIQSAEANIKPVTLLKAGATVGYYKPRWGQTIIPAVTNKAVVANAWGGSDVSTGPAELKNLTYPAVVNSLVGSIRVQPTGSLNSTLVSVSLARSFSKPTLKWRLLHP
jgi:D-alanyl-D-alanine carboxypeptidase (penicillin-binding protein 5/6)